MGKIKTKYGTYEYKELKFESGISKINREIAKENLLILKKCFDNANFKFGLIYGTLLGAIRENNFIAHDEDTDIFILGEEKDKLFDLLFELRIHGFEVGRLLPSLMSIVRKGEYIDIYFYERKSLKIRECEGYIIKSDILENLENYTFLGESFQVPKNPKELLVKLYGSNWMIPDKKAKAQNYGIYLKIKFFIKNNCNTLYKIIRWSKKHFKILDNKKKI